MKQFFLFLLCFAFFQTLVFSQEETIGTGQRWRLEISNLKIVETNRNNVLFQFDLSNTGKEDIELPYSPAIENIEVVFDDTLKKSQYAYFQHLIKEQLGVEELFLPLGLVKEDFQLEILLPKTKKVEREKVESRKVESGTLDSISILKKDSVQTFKKVKNLNLLAFSKDSLFKIFRKDTVFTIQKIDSLLAKKGKKEILLLHSYPIVYTFSVKDSLLKSNDICEKPDFVIDTSFILKKDKKNVKVKVRIKNIGNEQAQLLGQTPDIQDNVIIKSYFSAFPKYTNGSIFARGIYIDDEAKFIHNSFSPSQTLDLEFEIPLKNKSKFTPFIVLEINGNATVEECSVDNNFYFIKIED
jgi:hypothetical protein